VGYWLKLRVILAKENDLNAFIKELFMKKIITAVAMASLLSGCQLIEQLQGSKQKPSTLPTSSTVELPAAQAQSLDAQFERIKKGKQEVTFNGEKFYKQTKAFDKSEDPRFLSGAANVDRSNRKFIMSETYYLKDVSHIPALTNKYLDETKKVCDLKTISDASDVYYACDGNDFQRLVAVVHQAKNILSFRSLKAYQEKPTEAQEQAIVGVSVSEQVKFIVVAKDNVSNSPLFSDVRLALELNKEYCLCLNFDQIQHITLQHSVRYWLLAENADEIDRTLPYCLNAERVYRSVDWQQFQQDSQAKRELWQQIQQI